VIIKRQGIWVSYLIVAPIGLLAIFIMYSFPMMLTGEGLTSIALIGVYGKATLGLFFLSYSSWFCWTHGCN